MDALIYPPNTSKIKKHSASPANNRNQIIEYALVKGFTHIFFTDDDHVYPQETLTRLLSRDKMIVSGIYTMKCAPFPIVAFDQVSEDTLFSRFIDMTKVSPTELTEVKAVGAGCLLVNTEVFLKIQPPWFTLGQIYKDRWGDDMWFCKLAREAGYEIWIDPIVRVGHMTKVMLVPSYNLKNKKWEVGYNINEGVIMDAGEHD